KQFKEEDIYVKQPEATIETGINSKKEAKEVSIESPLGCQAGDIVQSESAVEKIEESKHEEEKDGQEKVKSRSKEEYNEIGEYRYSVSTSNKEGNVK
ncbi:45427_t:CDS:1, partial [Gigaspora margarita]